MTVNVQVISIIINKQRKIMLWILCVYIKYCFNI